MKQLSKLLLVLLVCSSNSFCCLAQKSGAGARIGVTIMVGKPISRIGFSAHYFQFYDFFQINIGSRVLYNFKTWGPGLRSPEFQCYAGAVLAYGKIDRSLTPIVSIVGNQTGRSNSVAYSYMVYRDKISTSQRSGTFAVQFSEFVLVSENDVFSGTGRDRFRTGGLMAGMYVQNLLVSVNTMSWTGNTSSKKVIRVKESDYPSRFGYNDLSNVEHGRFSHGVFALQVLADIGYGQMVGGRVGFDSERVRHIFQNRLVHDAALWPKKWRVHANPHYPMLDTEGQPFLFRQGQEIRKTRGVLQFFSNDGLFY